MHVTHCSACSFIIAPPNPPTSPAPPLPRPATSDRHVTVVRPDLVGRSRIRELHARGKPFSVDVDFAQVARRTPGFSGADLANVVNEAALLSIRQARQQIEPPDVEEAVQRTLIGTVRK